MDIKEFIVKRNKWVGSVRCCKIAYKVPKLPSERKSNIGLDIPVTPFHTPLDTF